MNIRQSLDAAISVLQIVKDLTATNVDDELLGFMVAVRQSDPLLDWIEAKLPGPDAPQFTSTELLEKDVPQPLRDNFSFRDILKFMPVIIAIIQALRDAGVLEQEDPK